MIRKRFRTRFVSLLAILTTAMTGLIVGATSASAMRPPEPPTDVSNIVFVPTPPVTQLVTETQGLDWWAIVLIAAAAAIVAATLTELYNWMQNRRHHLPLSTA